MSIKHRHSLLAALVLEEVESLNISNPRLLEIGAEPGWFADRVAKRSRYLGLEPSSEGISLARENVPHAEFVQSSFLDWEPGDATFDVVLLVDRLSSLPDHSAVFKKIAQILTPGGHVVVATENPIVWKGLHWLPPLQPGDIRDWVGRKNLHALIHRAELQRLKSYSWYPYGGRSDGIFRIINGEQVNRLVNKIVPEAWTRRIKEMSNLGMFRVVIARRSP